MKKIVEGKSYSKRTKLKLESLSDIESYFLKTPNGGGWRQQVSKGVKAATTYLKSQVLPTSPQVFKAKSSPKWQSEPPIPSDFEASYLLDCYIKKIENKERDSLEDLCARVIVSAWNLKKAETIDDAVSAAFQYQQARTLARVYGLQSSNSGNTKDVERPSAKCQLKEKIIKLMRGHKQNDTGFKVFMESWGSEIKDNLVLKFDENKSKYFVHNEYDKKVKKSYTWGTLEKLYSESTK